MLRAYFRYPLPIADMQIEKMLVLKSPELI